MVRRTACIALPLLVVVGLVVTAAPVHADAVPRFRACAAVSRTGPRCYNGGVTYELGQTVFLRGRLVPARPGFGQVLRKLPAGRRYVRFGTIGVQPDGSVRWSWTPTRRDVRPAAPYRIALRAASVRSNPVEVWIVPRHNGL